MFAYVLVLLSCAYALSEAAVNDSTPHYVQARAEYKVWAEALEKNIVSMSVDIPPMTDPRRHHAIIFHVIFYEAKQQSQLWPEDYDKVYIKDLCISVSEAFAAPEKVISSALVLLKYVDDNTKNITHLIDTCKDTVDECNEKVDIVVKNKAALYDSQVKKLLRAGKAARKFNKQAGLYNIAANNLVAPHFVITSKDLLKGPVFALANLYWIKGEMTRNTFHLI